MSKKIFALIIVSVLVGGAVGSFISVQPADAGLPAQAGIWSSVWDFLTRGVSSSTPSRPSTPSQPIQLYKPVLDYEDAVIEAVQSATPGVVSIVISKDVPVIEQCPYDPFSDLPPEFQQFFGGGVEFSQPCQKGTQKQDVGGGSGFIVSEDGLIATNKHVVSDAKADYTVFTNDGKKFTAKVIAIDPVQDLALIKIDGAGFKPVKLGDSDGLKLGQTAIAIGNALGEFRNTVSVGVISGLSRSISASGQDIGTEALSGVIQTDAAINPGNSGGPLLDLKGEVVGIDTAMASGAQSIGFAIPINSVKRAIESVKRTGTIKSSYLGVRYLLVTEDIAKSQKLSVDYGALVRGTESGPAVIPDSPAAKAGIQAEDIITEINNEKVTQDMSLVTLLQKYNIGDTITVTLRRGKETKKIQATLEERPATLK
ncbi:MAG: trypsin-like peptidase domain-containing protein [Candidatus Jorgensenbacteria bacterium]|nr:trypsin-like peptidase domain-containing protein [Candidatus Jorgensenbacteria bacterium]